MIAPNRPAGRRLTRSIRLAAGQVISHPEARPPLGSPESPDRIYGTTIGSLALKDEPEGHISVQQNSPDSKWGYIISYAMRGLAPNSTVYVRPEGGKPPAEINTRIPGEITENQVLTRAEAGLVLTDLRAMLAAQAAVALTANNEAV